MKNIRIKHILKLTILFFALIIPFVSYTQSEAYLPRWEVGVNFRFILEFDQDVPPLLLKYYLGKERKSALRFTLNPDLVLSSGYFERSFNIGRYKTFLHDEDTWIIEKALNIHIGLGWEKHTHFNKFSINRGVNLSWGYKDITWLNERYIGGRSNGNGEQESFKRVERLSIGAGVNLGAQYHLSKRVIVFVESQLNAFYDHYPHIYSGRYDVTNREIIQVSLDTYTHQRIRVQLNPFYLFGISYLL